MTTSAHTCPDLGDLPALSTIAGTAAFMQVHDRTIRRYLARGLLGFVRVGGLIRIPKAAIAAFLGVED